MISLEHARALSRYNRWMNEKLYAIADALGDEERKRDRGAFFKSIHLTLNHLLLADRVWMARFEGDPSRAAGIASLADELYADFDELRRARVTMDDAIDAYVASLDAATIAGPLRYTRRGEAMEEPLGWALAHLFNHQTHHRGQVTALMMQAGRDPGVTDLIAMLRDERA